MNNGNSITTEISDTTRRRKRVAKFVAGSPIFIGVAAYIVCLGLSLISIPISHTPDFWFRFPRVALSWFRSNQCPASNVSAQLMLLDHVVLPISILPLFPLLALLRTRHQRASYYRDAYLVAIAQGKKRSWTQWPSTTAIVSIALSAWIFWMLFSPETWIFYKSRAHADAAPLALCYAPRIFIAGIGIIASGAFLFAGLAIPLCLAIIEHRLTKAGQTESGIGP